VGVEVPADAGGETAPLSLRLEIDLPGRSVRIHLDEESEPISIVYREGRWRSADAG
jgi:hypothetical protein